MQVVMYEEVGTMIQDLGQKDGLPTKRPQKKSCNQIISFSQEAYLAQIEGNKRIRTLKKKQSKGQYVEKISKEDQQGVAGDMKRRAKIVIGTKNEQNARWGSGQQKQILQNGQVRQNLKKRFPNENNQET